CFPNRGGKLRALGLLAAEWFYIRACSGRRAVRAFDEQYRGAAPPDVVVASCVGWAGVTPALALHRRGIPFVLEFRDPWKSYDRETWHYHVPRVHRAARQALVLMNVTPLLCERDAAEFGKESVYIPHGVPPEFLGTRVGQPQDSAAPLSVAYFGSMLYPY